MQAWPRALTHVGLTVTDLKKAIHWYGDFLGLQVIAGPSELVGDDSEFGKIVSDIFGANFGRGRLVFLAGANGVVVEIFEFENPKSERGENNFEFWKNGCFHICFVDPEIEMTANKIAESGGKLRSKSGSCFRTNLTRSPIVKTRLETLLSCTRIAPNKHGVTSSRLIQHQICRDFARPPFVHAKICPVQTSGTWADHVTACYPRHVKSEDWRVF
jgi:catechol 2,3-dioxygenase-like lactoylglutathione lyase family enzyme